VVRIINLFNKGAMPILGGVLDQASWFLDAAEFFTGDCTRLEAPNGD